MISAKTERRLDDFQESLPTIPAAIMRTNRVVTRHAFDTAASVAKTLGRSFERVSSSAQSNARTATEQIRNNADQAVSAVEGAASNSAKQIRRHARNTSTMVADEVETIADKAEDAMVSSPSGAYETWTKAELYDRAQELDVDGRSSMNKKQLIGALRSSN